MKKFLALLLAMSMAFSLCACGSNSGASGTSDSSSVPSSDLEIADTDPTTEVDGPNGSDSQPNTENSANMENSGITDNPSDETVESEPATALSGLILMTTTDSNLRDPKIYSVNVETGESELIAEFNFTPKTLQDTVLYFLAEGFRCGHQDCFADNYSKVAVSMTDSQSGQNCAGWIDAEGNFFNVSEALGQLNRGDFDDVVKYYAVGFFDNEFFIYRQIAGTGASAKSSYHYIPLDNLDPSAIQDGLPFPGCESGFPKVTISDCIGGSRFLINTSDGMSQIFDMATGEKTSYVPGTSRFSWHGVLSPDGSQVTFMSQPKNGTEIDIYVMPLAGGDPVKVPTDGFKLSYQQACESGRGYDNQVTMLVDWR